MDVQPLDDPISLGEKLASGDMHPAALRWMSHGLALYFKAGGRVPLERLLHLATTPARLRRAQRNVWLRAASQEIGRAHV